MPPLIFCGAVFGAASRFALLLGCIGAAVLLSSCGQSSPRAESRVYDSGEKAMVGPLTYNVVDSRILPRLGDNPATARLPQNRFYLVQVSITNAGNSDAAIPAMTLVDDKGQTWNELTDGSGVSNWLGIVRRVKPQQSVQGAVIFDAPAQHYRLRLTDDSEDAEIFIDMPLTFVHEQLEQSEMGVPGGTVPAKR
jgi:hypothetical protein